MSYHGLTPAAAETAWDAHLDSMAEPGSEDIIIDVDAEYDPDRLPGFGARPEYLSTLQLAADSPDKLRTADVFRVIEDAFGRGWLIGFVAWLKLERPDLEDEIAECIEDLEL